mmetsp:Transcript_7400/g.13797  ORF Transcript_7400/g.13797 Transcript_7400/m.13797 type:complete len:211 (-) Transcript_7400:32-664(-)
MDKSDENPTAYEYIAKLKEEEEREYRSVKKYETITGRQWKAVGLYTLGFFALPIGIYSNQRTFDAFRNFHNRLLNLGKKGPGGLFGWAFLMSIVYSTAAIPIYYKGALWILGLDSLRDLHGVMTDQIVSRFELDEDKPKMKKLKELDNHFIYKLDEIAGFDKQQTDNYLDATFSRPIKRKPNAHVGGKVAAYAEEGKEVKAAQEAKDDEE